MVRNQSFSSSPSTTSTMHGFITTPSARVPFRNLVRPSLCRVQRANVSFRAPVVSTMSARPLSGDVDESAFEDDDATLGGPSRVFGMQLPDLTDDDKAYLNAAVSNEDFMARMTRIAHRIDAARKRINVASGRMNPDAYMESLKRAPPDWSGQDLKSTGSTPADDYMNSLKGARPKLDDMQYDARGTNEGEEYIQQLSRKREEQMRSKEPPSRPKPNPVDESVRKVQDLQAHLRSHGGGGAADLPPDTAPEATALDAQIAELQEKLRAAAGEGDVDVETPTAQQAHPADTGSLNEEIAAMEAELRAATGKRGDDGAVGEVDKQIDFLEGYLSKLKQEEEQKVMKERLSGAVDDLARSTDTGPQFEGLGSAPGELSEQEKKDAFEAIRKQAMMRAEQMQDKSADPLAKPLPTRRTDKPGEEEDVDVDLGKGARLSDAYVAISDLEAEVKKYLFDAKQLLSDHETKMNALLAKLRDL